MPLLVGLPSLLHRTWLIYLLVNSSTPFAVIAILYFFFEVFNSTVAFPCHDCQTSGTENNECYSWAQFSENIVWQDHSFIISNTNSKIYLTFSHLHSYVVQRLFCLVCFGSFQGDGKQDAENTEIYFHQRRPISSSLRNISVSIFKFIFKYMSRSFKTVQTRLIRSETRIRFLLILQNLSAFVN